MDCFDDEPMAELATPESIFKFSGFFIFRLPRPSPEFFLEWSGGEDNDAGDDSESDFLFSILDVHFMYFGFEGLRVLLPTAVSRPLLVLLLFLALSGSCESIVGMVQLARCHPRASRDRMLRKNSLLWDVSATENKPARRKHPQRRPDRLGPSLRSLLTHPMCLPPLLSLPHLSCLLLYIADIIGHVTSKWVCVLVRRSRSSPEP